MDDKKIPIMMVIQCKNGTIHILLEDTDKSEVKKVAQDWEYYMREFNTGNVIDPSALFEYLDSRKYKFAFKVGDGEIQRYTGGVANEKYE